MKRLLLAAVLAVPMAAQADDITASGDAAAGEKAFGRQCVACHVVVDADGNKLAGRSAKTGPNLYGVAGRALGSVDGFRYGKPLAALGEGGQVWTEEAFVGYVQDPTGWLREATGDSKARGKMAFKVRSETDAVDLFAYLHSLAN